MTRAREPTMAEQHHSQPERLNGWRVALSWTYLSVSTFFWAVGAVLYYLAVGVFFILKLLYRPLAFLLQPVVYFGRFIYACIVAPFRLLVKLEVCSNYISNCCTCY